MMETPAEKKKRLRAANHRRWWWRHHERNLERLATKRKLPSRRYSNIKSRAKARDLEFDISIEQYTEITSRPCHYCGKDLGTIAGGLDRKDNNKGYTLDNVLPCCCDCNRIRNNVMTVEETEFVVNALLQFRNNNGKVKVVPK